MNLVRISDVIQKWSEQSPEEPALVEGGVICTYGQLASLICIARKCLIANGVRPGDRVMLVGDNSRALAVFILAVAGLDAWPVLVNANLSAQEVDHIRDHCTARRLIYTGSASPHAKAHITRQGGIVEEVGSLGSIGLGPLNKLSEPEKVELTASDRVGALLYTSGSTGVPKGVMLSHKALLFVAAGSATIRSLTPADRIYGVLPMTHAVGLSVILLGGLLSGATIYLTRRFDPVATLRSLEKDELTVLLGAPAMFSLLVEYAKMKRIKSLSFPSLRIIASASAPLLSPLKSAVEDLFGLVLHNGYGLTECSPNIAQTRIESPRTDTSVGPAFPGVEIKLVGPDREPVAQGEVGEVLVRGPNVMKGYYRAPLETAAAIDAEGWFNTHDLGRMQDNNLILMGRTKDLIIHCGHKVYPAEVESVLNSHPAVIRSAVFGRTSGEAIAGEDIMAVVQVLSGSSLRVSELAEYVAQRLATYKRPSRILFVTQMPETPTGKIIKDQIQRLVDSTPPLYDIETVKTVTA